MRAIAIEIFDTPLARVVQNPQPAQWQKRSAAVAGKRLRELMPTATVIDYLVNPDNALGQPEQTLKKLIADETEKWEGDQVRGYQAGVNRQSRPTFHKSRNGGSHRDCTLGQSTDVRLRESGH
jgi:hypothetical protein